jgi:hypothetical protein
VVKNLKGDNLKDIGPRKGEYVEVNLIDNSKRSTRVNDGIWIWNQELTTEYLELVEEPKEECECGGSGECQHECHFITSMHSHECDGTCQKCEAKSEPIKQSIIKKSMSFIKRLTQSSDDKALLKARFTDDCGNLTSRGHEALTSLVFAEKKTDLVKLAEEVIAEDKE